MNYTRLNNGWNAEPNAPEVVLTVNDNIIILEFYLNHELFDSFNEGDKATLTFNNCLKYSFNGMNDEGYYRGHYRYNYETLPWGEFYQLDSNWQIDFPIKHEVLGKPVDDQVLRHFIFFFRDNTFECVAESYELQLT